MLLKWNELKATTPQQNQRHNDTTTTTKHTHTYTHSQQQQQMCAYLMRNFQRLHWKCHAFGWISNEIRINFHCKERNINLHIENKFLFNFISCGLQQQPVRERVTESKQLFWHSAFIHLRCSRLRSQPHTRIRIQINCLSISVSVCARVCMYVMAKRRRRLRRISLLPLTDQRQPLLRWGIFLSSFSTCSLAVAAVSVSVSVVVAADRVFSFVFLKLFGWSFVFNLFLLLFVALSRLRKLLRIPA